MPVSPIGGGDAATLTGRRAERAALDRLLTDVRAGESRALVLHGEPGVGKTALLDHLAGRAPDCRIARVAGVEPEAGLAFAGVHQLCAPMLDHLGRLPAPQRHALRTAFGMSDGTAPDPFLTGLAVLGLLSAAAGERPLLCLIDDHQWLDRASSRTLAFAARHLEAEPVGVVFASRAPDDDLAGLPELHVEGLGDDDARTLLGTALTAPLDPRILDRIVSETRGNPRALLELPRGRTPTELAGGFGLPGTHPSGRDPGDGFRYRLTALPAGTQRLLLLAAADPTGDAALLWRAARHLGIETEAAAPATAADLAGFGARVRFRHPQIRAAVYEAASPSQRREAHHALAEATDPETDPDRRAWHRSQAAPGPDETVAEDLERSANRARSRAGFPAETAFLERAATLTLDPARRSGRALAAAAAGIQAGAFETARDLLRVATAGPLNEAGRAQADLLRARLAHVTDRGGEAPLRLIRAAKRLAPIDAKAARAAYLDALSAAMATGPLATPGGEVQEVARATAGQQPPHRPEAAPDLLLAGLAANVPADHATGGPVLRRALVAFDTPPDGDLRSLWAAALAALHLWDDTRYHVLTSRYVRLARASGALGELPRALDARACGLALAGDLTTAASLTEEARAVAEATGTRPAPCAALCVAALRGRSAEAPALIEVAARRGEGLAVTVADWANAVLLNGLGDYPGAMAAALRSLGHQRYPDAGHLGPASRAAPELVEAAARGGMDATADEAIRWITAMAGACGTGWALGIEARSRALRAGGRTAERLYRESIARLARTRLRPELARAHLLFGEWLRRERRRAEARTHLHTAHRMLEAMGMDAFAERAGRELRATGESTATGDGELTAQEAQIARLARDGLSNPEIGTRLFISARTVQYHLRKVFLKLGITSRAQLDRVL
ncbi:helix-turn-helix transcriptional regulator [Actinomadura livida]|uniref:DNA-binding CsgD family transcriptional regulator n=1 Tax=Actinomadura livida TaxID=79909 RepID=A0A7W7ICL0_9ACTN|nr:MULTISPECIES: LuxR family transcriptional regulator [Actinomadura]MBB4774583.1 DNA-binding CsgD family transcriptional regulator [Actinomadura catellatispora]GGU07303.1 helix-turn-helix transcriptional regulator [Actinomadura livida]